MINAADITPPRARTNFLCQPEVEADLVQAFNSGALANGWLITGGEGAGKATLAFRLARALLCNEHEKDNLSLAIPISSQIFNLVASGGHPDLFVAERQYDEKKERLATEISVDVIRNLTHFLSHTASMGGWRVAIIDTADDLNRNSANALLKALEEPPPRTAVFVLSTSPGRLLATIRSRCRRIDLRPLPTDLIAEFLIGEAGAGQEDATRIANASGGRPGFALSLALGDGGEAIETVDEFWAIARRGGDVSAIGQRLAARNADSVWQYFRAMLVERLARDAANDARAQGSAAGAIADLRERIDAIFTRGDAVNLDRVQMVMAAGRLMRKYYALGH